MIEISWFIGRFKHEIFDKCLLLLIQILDFVTEDDFDTKFHIFYNQFQHNLAAKKFIDEKLILNKEKTVAFVTKHIFTACHTSSQRSEVFKGFGTMKREMTTWNSYKLMTQLNKCVKRIYIIFIELNRLTKFRMKIVNM